MKNNFKGLRLALMIALSCGSALLAQRDLATLVGNVTDPSGGVVVNATVTITEVDTGLVYTVTTSGTGDFVRPALKPSTYNISVKAAGFKSTERKSILLRSGERTGVDFVLSVGDASQTVEITATSPLLQTESTQV